MKTAPLSLLRRLDRSLVYTSLDQVVGKRARVASAESALDDVIAALAEHLPITVTTNGPDLRHLEGAIAKYGLLDLTYGIASTTLPIDRPGISLLRGVGLVEGSEPDPDGLFSADDFLNEMVLEAEGPDLYLKLFLQTEIETPAEMMRFSGSLPAGFWPATFIVNDACLTNARSIWLMKHLYL